MSGGLHSLATIIKRLEAATSRLEDLALAQASSAPKREEPLDELAPGQFSGTAVPPPPPPPPPPLPSSLTPDVPKAVSSFDENILNDKLKSLVTLTESLGSPLVVEQIGHVSDSYKALRKIILAASACTKPDQKSFVALLSPVSASVTAVARVPENNRKEKVFYNHLTFIAGGAVAVGWVQVESKPAQHVSQTKEEVEFWGNKIIKEFKEKDTKHVEWARAYLSLLEQLKKYVLEFHPTGLAWNQKGVPITEFSAAQAAPATPAPPPPPPPPPVGVAPASAPAAGGAAAIFAELNRGEAVTAGLRKVDKSEMTHKNPELRASSKVPAASSPPKRPIKPSKPQALMSKKPAKFLLEGNKWLIEYQENESALLVDETTFSQTINLYGCKNCTVQVKGKVNAVTLVNCTKTSILVESVISSVSITNSPSFALQITGSAPTIQIDSTDSGQIYISKDCLGVSITTAKCSSINVSLPVEGEEEGVFVEKAVPEMLISTIQDGKLVTSIFEHSA